MSDQDFRVIKIDSIKIEWVESLHRCIENFLKESGEVGISASDIMSHLEKSLDNGVCLAVSGDEVHGFGSEYLYVNPYGKKICFMDYLYVDNEARKFGAAKKIILMGISWARSMGATELMFLTRRNAKAMCRLFPGDWKIGPTLISLCV